MCLLLRLAALARAGRENPGLFYQHLFRRLEVIPLDLAAGYDLLQGEDAEPVHAPVLMGELIFMTAVFDDLRALHESHGMACTDSQPEIIILAGGQALIEQPDLGEDALVEHGCRGGDYAQGQAALKDAAPALGMLAHGIHPDAVADPDLLGVTEGKIGAALQGLDLGCQFGWQPFIIGVEKRQPFPLGMADAQVPRAADPLIGLVEVDAFGKPLLNQCPGAIAGAIIDDDHFIGPGGLVQNR